MFTFKGYHGSKRAFDIIANGFDPKLYGTGGCDQRGSGIYFSSDYTDASNYGRVLTGNVTLKNPLRTNWRRTTIKPVLTVRVREQIITSAPNIADADGPLSNWPFEGSLRARIRNAALQYGPDFIFHLGNDFYNGSPYLYLRMVHMYTGHDGWIHDFQNGLKHVIAWFPEQITDLKLAQPPRS